MQTLIRSTIVAAIVAFAALTAIAQGPGSYLNNRGAPPPAGLGSQPLPNQFQQQGANRQAAQAGLSNDPKFRIASNPTHESRSAGFTPSSEASSDASQEGSGSIQTDNLLSVIREGGLVMIPILFCSFILVVFILERLLFLRRGRVIPKPFVRGVIEQLDQQQLDQDEAIKLCEDNGSPIAQLFTAALKKWNRPAVEMEQAVVDAGTHVSSQLRRYLRFFNAISNLTPLLGLLGTVTGMIEAFNSIAQADAMGRPELLASGIGSALITTAAGLCVAIPAYAAYVYFLGRTDKLILEMDSLVSNVVELTSAEALQSNRRAKRKVA